MEYLETILLISRDDDIILYDDYFLKETTQTENITHEEEENIVINFHDWLLHPGISVYASLLVFSSYLQTLRKPDNMFFLSDLHETKKNSTFDRTTTIHEWLISILRNDNISFNKRFIQLITVSFSLLLELLNQPFKRRRFWEKQYIKSILNNNLQKWHHIGACEIKSGRILEACIPDNNNNANDFFSSPETDLDWYADSILDLYGNSYSTLNMFLITNFGINLDHYKYENISFNKREISDITIEVTNSTSSESQKDEDESNYCQTTIDKEFKNSTINVIHQLDEETLSLWLVNSLNLNNNIEIKKQFYQKCLFYLRKT